MYIVIDRIKYPRLAALSFAPETDLTGDGMGINQFTADIITQDDIRIGRYAWLYDDRDRLWAKYWVTYAERQSHKTIRIVAESDLRMLDNRQLVATMWQNESVPDMVRQLFVGSGSVFVSPVYVLDDAFATRTVSGYCPEQSARERLQLLCMHIGAYIRSYGSEYIEITRLDDTETLIPLNRTFWRPSITYRDWVTKLIIRDYDYEEGEPGPTDDYVKIDDVTWLQRWLEVQYDNQGAPAGAPRNEVRADEMTLTNATDMSARLAAYWFGRTDVELDVINNGEYWPGDRVMIYTDPETIYVGYIEKCDFTFGLQARSKLTIAMAEPVETVVLTVNYQYDGETVATRKINLPTDFQYTYQSPAFDRVEGGVLATYTPDTASRTINLSNIDVTQTETCTRTQQALT